MIRAAGISSQDRVLEIGCGTGEYARKIHELAGATVTGVDLSPKFIELASRQATSEKLSFHVGDVLRLPFSDGIFDVVCGNGIIHHIPEKKELFEEIQRVLAKDGRIVFLEPNLTNPLVFLIYKTRLRKFVDFDPLEMAFTGRTVDTWLKKFGLRQRRITPVDFVLPNTPAKLVSLNLWLSNLLERIPWVRGISQSLLIFARKREGGVV